MKKYDSAASISFVVLHDDFENPTFEELMSGLERRLQQFKENPSELFDCVDVYDTIDNCHGREKENL